MCRPAAARASVCRCSRRVQPGAGVSGDRGPSSPHGVAQSGAPVDSAAAAAQRDVARRAVALLGAERDGARSAVHQHQAGARLPGRALDRHRHAGRDSCRAERSRNRLPGGEGTERRALLRLFERFWEREWTAQSRRAQALRRSSLRRHGGSPTTDSIARSVRARRRAVLDDMGSTVAPSPA